MADPRPLVDTYSPYIDGRWVDPEAGRYDDISLATEATIADGPDAGLADLDAAISAARRAFDSGPWGAAAPAERAGCLNQAGSALMQHADEPIDAFGTAGATPLRHEPLGVVSIQTPSNFPHSLNVMKASRALASGNTLALKPSPLTPLAGLALARIIDAIAVPFGGFAQSGLPVLHQYMEPKAIGIPAGQHRS